jgi:hypothetical protein
MTGDGGTLESLDLDDHILQKLEGVGILSISDLATTTTPEFLESYYSNYDESVGGIDYETISLLVLKVLLSMYSKTSSLVISLNGLLFKNCDTSFNVVIMPLL